MEPKVISLTPYIKHCEELTVLIYIYVLARNVFMLGTFPHLLCTW